MSKVEALTALRAKVEAGDRSIFASMTGAMLHTFGQREINWIQSAHDGSLDAAKALHEAVIAPMDSGEWDFVITSYGDGEDEPLFEAIISRSDEVVDYQGHNDNPARAWLIAIIKALIAEASA